VLPPCVYVWTRRSLVTDTNRHGSSAKQKTHGRHTATPNARGGDCLFSQVNRKVPKMG
jgi:hypothetical protein